MTQYATLQSVLTTSFNRQMESVFTSLPAIVVSVRDNLNQLAIDAQPTLDVLKEDGSVTKRPVILNIPVSMPINMNGGMTHPVKKGDTVMLIFSKQGLDTWKRSNGAGSIPRDHRTFHVKDCIAIPISTLPNSINAPNKHTWTHSPNDVVMFHNVGTSKEVEIRLKDSGDVHINTNSNIKVFAGGSVQVDTQDATINSTSTTVNTNTASVNASSMSVTAPSTTWTGNISIAGNLALAGGMTMTGGDSGSGMTMTGDIVHTGNFTIQGTHTVNGVVFEEHKHGGVQSGGSTTGGVV